MIERQKPGVYSVVHDHRFAGAIQEILHLDGQWGKSAIEPDAQQFVLRLQRGFNSHKFLMRECKRLFAENMFTGFQRSHYL